MDPKNKLQYILKSNGLKFHGYKYIIIKDKYLCKVIFEINNKNEEIYGFLKNNKIDSNNSANINACNYLYCIKKLNQKDEFTNNHNKNIVLIDVENVGYKYFNKKSRIIGFISKQCLYNKIDIIKKYMELEIYDGKDKNGADTMMLFYIGRNIDYYIKNKIHVTIISNDSFSKCAYNILNKHNIKCELKKTIK